MPPDALIWRDVDARPSGTGRADHLAVASTARTPDGHDVDVVLHVVHGRVHELEVLDTVEGEGAAVDSAALSDPAGPTVA